MSRNQLDETLPYEEDDDKLGLTTLFEPPQPQQDNVQVQHNSQVSANQETSNTDLTQISETILADMLESNPEPLFSNQETIEVAPKPASQPVRTARIRKKTCTFERLLDLIIVNALLSICLLLI